MYILYTFMCYIIYMYTYIMIAGPYITLHLLYAKPYFTSMLLLLCLFYLIEIISNWQTYNMTKLY